MSDIVADTVSDIVSDTVTDIVIDTGCLRCQTEGEISAMSREGYLSCHKRATTLEKATCHVMRGPRPLRRTHVKS